MTFETDLSNQIPTIIDYIGEGIQSVLQLRNFLKEKSTIEREYAQKLESLTKKYKGRKKTTENSSSDDWDWDDTAGTFTSSWLQLINQTGLVAKEKIRLSDDINNIVVESLKDIASRKEEAKKKHATFYQKIRSDRDKTFANKDKAKQLYDEACVEIENIRHKLSKSSGDQDKLQRHLDTTVLDRDNKKNLYLLSIAEANAQGAKYIEKDTPSLANHLEELDASRILAVKSVLKNYIDLESRSISISQQCHNETLKSIESIDPTLDAGFFIRKALTKEDSVEKQSHVTFTFIPWNGGVNAAETIIDRDDTLVASDSAIIYLNNKLLKDRKLMDSIGEELVSKSNEFDELRQYVSSIENKASPDYDASNEKLMNLYRDITLLSTQLSRVESEVNLIISNIGDDGLRAENHTFKSASFTIPTSCDFCNGTIWGISNKGVTCKACGFNCHVKCEMKVAQNCSGQKGKINPQPNPSTLNITSSIKRKKSTSTQVSLQSPTGYQETTIQTIPITLQEINTTIKKPSLKCIYDYDAQNSDELSIQEGDKLRLVETDDGSGWIKVSNGIDIGLIPATYIEYLDNITTMNNLEKEYNDDKTVIVLYDFKADHPEELDLKTGDIIIVTKKDDSGWWEGRLNGRVGIFPSNYVSSE